MSQIDDAKRLDMLIEMLERLEIPIKVERGATGTTIEIMDSLEKEYTNSMFLCFSSTGTFYASRLNYYLCARSESRCIKLLKTQE